MHRLYHIPSILDKSQYLVYTYCSWTIVYGVVNLPMPPLCSAFRITVESHYSLAGQALCVKSTRWPYRRYLGLCNLGFSLPPISYVFPKQVTDNCFRFYQYKLYLSKGYIKYFAQINTVVKNHSFHIGETIANINFSALSMSQSLPILSGNK